ncbi:MAG: HlyD family secretion protein [Prosthecobacter sp.]|uniref:HlyD family secretion protein n=1 Tax=Prosthecobacter sp. TaxID=1965333 RepID=UPI003903934A
MLWRDAVSPAMLIGEVTSVKTSVTSSVAASVLRMHPQRLQMVKAGDIIAELRPTDTREALDFIQSKLTLLRLEAGMGDSTQDVTATQRREILDFERLRVDWLMEKVNLAIAEGKAKRATLELELAKSMVTEPANSQRYLQDADLAKTTADAELTERRSLVESLGLRIKALEASGIQLPPTQNERFKEEVATLEERLSTFSSNQDTITLRTPADGMVTEVLKRTGENVTAGDNLVVITSTQPQSIIGYLRQPLPLDPIVGMEAEVRSHNRERSQGVATVTRVGAHFEPILNPALHPATTPEVGLPVLVSLPPNLKLRPGELVSIVIRPSSGNKPTL